MEDHSTSPEAVSLLLGSIQVGSLESSSFSFSLVSLLDIEGNRITFREPRSQESRRLIALSPANTLILEEHPRDQQDTRESPQLPPIAENDLFFSHSDGSPLLPPTMTHAWIELVRKCGLDGIRLHDARYTHAIIMPKRGVHPKTVQERLGHSTISTTLDTYSHVPPGLQQAAAMAFDDILKKESALDKQLTEILQN